MITQGLVLMGIGMGTVLVFLMVMILAMSIESALMKPLAKFFPEPEEKKIVKRKPVSEDHEDIAVAIAAIKSFVK